MNDKKKIEKLEKFAEGLRGMSADTDMCQKARQSVLSAIKNQTKPSAQKEQNIWRLIMKTKTTKFAIAAVVIIAIMIGINQFGGSIDGASIVWADVVQKLELSYNKYQEDLLLAMEEKDLEKASSNADALSEFWQGIHILAEAKLDPTISLELEDSLNFIKLTFDKTFFDDIDKNIFQNYANEFMNWFSRIEDEAWVYEGVHISKQMEEYAEEIRDGGRHSELGLSYAEHCLPSFVTYSQWFEQLPWNNPEQYMAPDVILTAIERDMEIARQEINALKIRSVDRFTKRCIQQAQRNAQNLNKNTKLQQMANQQKLAHKLTQKTNELSGLISYLTVASGDITLRNKIHKPEAISKILTKEFGNKDSFAEYLIEQIDQALGLCDQLHEGFEYIQ